MSTDRVYNFSAGPAVLPEEALKRTRSVIWELGDTGIGLLEHSHRSPEFTRIIEQAEQRCREVGNFSDDYSVLFLQGGASSQFFMVPMNLLGEGQTADYINTGTWGQKAIKEAKKLGQVHVAASTEADQFRRIPRKEEIQYSANPAYVHYTSNNTIYGTEWTAPPQVPEGVPLICDASSDIFSKPIDVGAHGLIYAGAQKNLGPSGLTVVFLRKELADRAPDTLPTMLQYRTHVDAGSRFNTPPTLAIYVLNEVLDWIQKFGGLVALAEYNWAKAKLIYDHLQDSDFYETTADAGSRSLMNICFRTRNRELESSFIANAAERGLKGLKGHRSVGGMRASVYNAFPKAGCEALVDFMKKFELDNR